MINDETKAQYDNGTYYENNDFNSEENQYTPTEKEEFNYLSPKEKRVNLFVKLAAYWFIPFIFSIIMTILYFNVFKQDKNNMDLEDIESVRNYSILSFLAIYYVINAIIFFIFKNTIGGILFGYKYYDLYKNEKYLQNKWWKFQFHMFYLNLDVSWTCFLQLML